ncbi:GNAT family N-acetyltransferase [Roseibium suaedae]|uniref:Acetyltransferase (GNAT) domain-containing protein n=1 Tax=Roseibium suaedae TaxID=735517 RepID=A0A1M7GXV9_9HYPH|nr:GNAT family N-acetyltransferase [Roseibium suaedae]SHM20679.1 Acetyltransferase (GNAT) domain-containing protein [Roseibium suaedae]
MNDIVLVRGGISLHPFSDEDLPLVLDHHSDPEAHRFLSGNARPWDERQAELWLSRTLENQARHGFSTFKVTLRQQRVREAYPSVAARLDLSEGQVAEKAASSIRTGPQFLGWAGFVPIEETSEIGLSYSFSRAARSLYPTIARDICQGLTDWFFENTYFSHLVASFRTDDRDGRDMVSKLGFTYRESSRIDGSPCDLFQLLSPSMRSYVMSA